jgi:hypothetical protein
MVFSFLCCLAVENIKVKVLASTFESAQLTHFEILGETVKQ